MSEMYLSLREEGVRKWRASKRGFMVYRETSF